MQSLPFKIFFDPNLMSNIISLKETVKTFLTTVYIRKEHSILVHTINESVMKFREFRNRPYYFDTSRNDNTTNNKFSNYYLLSTIDDNKTYFTYQ